MFFFFIDTATTEIYPYCHTLSLHDALPIYTWRSYLGLQHGSLQAHTLGGFKMKIGRIEFAYLYKPIPVDQLQPGSVTLGEVFLSKLTQHTIDEIGRAHV